MGLRRDALRGLTTVTFFSPAAGRSQDIENFKVSFQLIAAEQYCSDILSNMRDGRHRHSSSSALARDSSVLNDGGRAVAVVYRYGEEMPPLRRPVLVFTLFSFAYEAGGARARPRVSPATYGLTPTRSCRSSTTPTCSCRSTTSSALT